MELIIDTEVTGAQRDKGHPFNLENKMCVVGVKEHNTNNKKVYKIEYDEEPYGKELAELSEVVASASKIIWFNAKFDLHWLRRYGVVPSLSTRYYDCQSAFFVLDGQRTRYPSLDGVAEHFGVEKKLDIVKTEYWEKGLDTDDVPYDVLGDYLLQDLEVTGNVYNRILDLYPNLPIDTQKIISLMHQDVRVLADMEWNGMLYNKEKSLRYGEQLVEDLARIDEELKRIFGAGWVNIDSGDHLSVLLYGGTLYMDATEDYIFTYKDGRTATKTRRIKVPHNFPRIFEPLEGSNLAKEGFYSTDKSTLVTLKERAKGEKEKILDLLLLRSRLEKRRGTYYQGFPKLIDKMNWSDDIIHGNLNQCTVITGRLSSDRPNLQNIEGEVKEVFVSRFSRREK